MEDWARFILIGDIMFSVSLQRDGHVRRYSIQQSGSAGWEVRLEADEEPARHDTYFDWHRVERVRDRFASEVSDLTAHGWEIVASR
jgi:Fe-S cluster assembly iron-binding protein IscA